MEDRIETQRKQLTNYQPRHVGMPMSGLGSLLFGVPFFGAGVGITFVGLKVIPVNPSSVHVPYWVITLIGGLFGVVGLWVMSLGARALVRASRRKRRLSLHPDEPWYADYAWDPDRTRDTPFARIIKMIVPGIFISLFLVPFHWVGLTQKGMGMIFLVFAGIFDLVIVYMIGYTIYLFVRYIKYGQSTLRFDRFPFFLGDTLEAHFVPSRGIGSFKTMRFTLRCIEIVWETRGSGKNRNTQAVPYQVWADTMEAGGGSLLVGAQVPVTFLLPDKVELVTRLSHNPPQYWELEVHAQTPGVDYKTSFLVPVYERQ